MPAYLIANVDVHDPARYERYRDLYAPVKRVRHETATSDLVIVEGL